MICHVAEDHCLTRSSQNVKTALSIFVERLPQVRSDVRTKSAPAITRILRQAATLLNGPSLCVSPALAAIRAVASTALSSEEAALAEVLPKLVESVGKLREVANRTAALSLVEMTA